MVRAPYTLQVDVALPVFETVSEWPPVTVTTPNVNLFLGPFETLSEWPALTLAFDQNFTLPAFETVSEWPAITVTIPLVAGDLVTTAGQVEWNYTLWGPGTDVAVLLPVEGWRGLPQVDNLNVARPAQHGAWDGRKLSQQRLVTLRLQPNSGSNPSQIDDMLTQIDLVTGLPESEAPLPLVVRGYGDPQVAYGQVIDRDVDMDGDYNAGLPTVTVLIACADPRRYNIEQTGVNVPVGIQTVLSNAGNTSTHPRIRVDGPVTNPTFANADTGRTLAFALDVLAGEQLVINTFEGTATVGGEPVTSTITGTSAPIVDFTLRPGTNRVTYSGDAGGDLAVALYRDAWL
ncbi:phage distal tail protein [Nonomuraea sp. NPDC049714]|uniref:phage distal tail protein n=1 Tax=Nonomuraea sp. NPDC049714 TaxID=3364357 RepID=UPI00378953FE